MARVRFSLKAAVHMLKFVSFERPLVTQSGRSQTRLFLNRIIAVFLLSTIPTLLDAGEMADKVLVDKSDEKLYLLSGETVLTEYNVSFGANVNK